VIATGVSADGHREVLGCQVGDSETEEFRTEFLRDLRGRGLAGVQLVVSDAHAGLVAAVGAVLQGRCCRQPYSHTQPGRLAAVPERIVHDLDTWCPGLGHALDSALSIDLR